MPDKNDTLSTQLPLLSRDLSWLDFNERVLDEGLRKDLPLLERFRFLSIVSANFDEFFMVRVAAIKRALNAGHPELGFFEPYSLRSAAIAEPVARIDPAQLLKEISAKTRLIIKKQSKCLQNEIFPGLAKSGLKYLRPDSYSVPQMDYLESFFIKQVFPVLTPLRIEDGMPLPFIESRTIYAAFMLEPESLAIRADIIADTGSAEKKHLVIIKLPPSLDRIIWLPVSSDASGADTEARQERGSPPGKQTQIQNSNTKPEPGKLSWTLLDDVTLTWGTYLFPGYTVKESMLFKINRDADFSVDEKRDEDFVEAMEEVLEGRGKSDIMRMVCSPGSLTIRDELAMRFSLKEDSIYQNDSPLNIGDLLELVNVAGFEELQEKPWKNHASPAFSDDTPIWDSISHGDIMLHLPYQSFDPVVRFFQDAAADPDVVSIKTTLYRTGGAIPGLGISRDSQSYSPIVRALEQAALNGKHVTVLVELKARFDEERNILWANRLEKAGVIVIYGLSRLKVHSKIAMVMRREFERIKRYVHLSTGNYNYKTAKLYEDICLFTCREDIAYDAGMLFNMLTGYSSIQPMTRLVIAPINLKGRFLELIQREIERVEQKYQGKIIAKLNSLTDVDIIKALYRASAAGVQISLCVRGICTLIPGIPGVSENIRVISVIDHYLEHSRIYYFSNGGADELYISSADWMQRNLERRVELMFPVLDEKIRIELLAILNDYFYDNCQARVLNSDGTWTRQQQQPGEKLFRVQKEMLHRAARDSHDPVKQEFLVRRSPPGDK